MRLKRVARVVQAVEAGVRAALETGVETREVMQVDVRGLRFKAEVDSDPFIPIAGVLLLKGIREDCDGPVYRELYTDDLSVMERIGMCASAADTWRDYVIRNSRST